MGCSCLNCPSFPSISEQLSLLPLFSPTGPQQECTGRRGPSTCACRSPCHVVYTEYRPTPLQHFAFPAGADGLFLVVDERGTFRSDNFAKAIATLTAAVPEPGAARSQAQACSSPGAIQSSWIAAWQGLTGRPRHAFMCTATLRVQFSINFHLQAFEWACAVYQAPRHRFEGITALLEVSLQPQRLDAGGKKGEKKGASGVNGKKSEESDMFKLVRMIMQRNFDPVSGGYLGTFNRMLLGCTYKSLFSCSEPLSGGTGFRCCERQDG